MLTGKNLGKKRRLGACLADFSFPWKAPGGINSNKYLDIINHGWYFWSTGLTT